MWNWTMNAVDGEYKRMTCYRVVVFNIYAHDPPISDETISFVYADNLCITAPYTYFPG